MLELNIAEFPFRDADLKGLAHEFLDEKRSINIARKLPNWDLYNEKGFIGRV